MQLNVMSETERREIETAVDELDTRALHADLERAVRGGGVRFDGASRGAYSTDASNYRQVPIGVVVPRDSDDVRAAVEVCHRHGAPIVSRGGGTSLAGQCCNTAVVIDFSKHMHRVLEVNVEEKWARVQPGCILDHLNEPLREKHNLIFGPDPSTHQWCTFGGMIGNNSCGVHSVMAGRTADNVLEMEVLTHDGERFKVKSRYDDAELQRLIDMGGRRGEIFAGMKRLADQHGDLIRERYPDIPRRVSGYNLDDLLPEKGFNVAAAVIGTEGTTNLILEAKVRLIHSPPVRSLVVVGFEDIYTAADQCHPIMEAYDVTAVEGMDGRLIQFMRKKNLHTDDLKTLPEGKGWLLVEFGGKNKDESDAKARELVENIKSKPGCVSQKLYDDPQIEANLWEVRKSSLGATAHGPNMADTWPGWEDAAVHPKDLGDYLRDFRKLLDQYGYGQTSLYGHFGQACIHCRIPFDLRTHDGIENYRAFVGQSADLVVKYRGSFSAEHGDGQSKAMFLTKLYGQQLIDAMREFKTLWDPHWKMNPGKVIDPYKPTDDLRLGTDYEPWEPKTHYHFPEDKGSFATAALRCVGVGKCRRTHDAFMCPSYLATREEIDSTRGRARLLFEMLNGEETAKGWKNDAVHEALDLCLGCKGCKTDCPVNVDMATYKSEFLSHYYHGRLRPAAAYAMGLIGTWAKLASLSPGLVNLVSHTPPLSGLVKAIGGLAQPRRMPLFAQRPFTRTYRRREHAHRDHHAHAPHGPVVLYVDVFNNYFHPATASAAAEVLERLGFNVILTPHDPPSIRPLLHYGFLPAAKRALRREVRRLRHYAREGIPIVGLEPSTVAVFRDELPNLYPDDEDAKRVTQNVKLLSELLREKMEADEIELPRLERQAVLHDHCHQKAVLQPEAMKKVLERLGIDYTEPEQGCCGMAGAFGFEREHYDISQQIGEQHLLPAVGKADADTLLIADGFSCRHQIHEAVGRLPMHLSQVVLMAMDQGPKGPDRPNPERGYVGGHAAKLSKAAAATGALALGATVGLGIGAVMWSRRR